MHLSYYWVCAVQVGSGLEVRVDQGRLGSHTGTQQLRTRPRTLQSNVKRESGSVDTQNALIPFYETFSI